MVVCTVAIHHNYVHRYLKVKNINTKLMHYKFKLKYIQHEFTVHKKKTISDQLFTIKHN